jgi:hypothetical protein
LLQDRRAIRDIGEVTSMYDVGCGPVTEACYPCRLDVRGWVDAGLATPRRERGGKSEGAVGGNGRLSFPLF